MEDTEMVDGLGGQLWDGSLVLSSFLQTIDAISSQETLKCVEVGCGSGLCGLVCAALGAEVVLTDRFIDLAEKNIQTAKIDFNDDLKISAERLDWTSDRLDLPGVDLVLGAEVACLRRQQKKLAETLAHLAQPTRTIFLLTFDGFPPREGVYSSASERDFDGEMVERGYGKGVVHTSRVRWTGEAAALEDLTRAFPHSLDRLSLCLTPATATTLPAEAWDESNKKLDVHHVNLYYPRLAARTCSRCQQIFFPQSPLAGLCRFHRGFFVCRLHPAELRCSIDGLGDGRGYYDNGMEGIYLYLN